MAIGVGVGGAGRVAMATTRPAIAKTLTAAVMAAATRASDGREDMRAQFEQTVAVVIVVHVSTTVPDASVIRVGALVHIDAVSVGHCPLPPLGSLS